MTDQNKRPRVIRVALLALLGVIISAACKILYDELLILFPDQDSAVKVAVVIIFSVLMSYLCIKPMMNEFGQHWRN